MLLGERPKPAMPFFNWAMNSANAEITISARLITISCGGIQFEYMPCGAKIHPEMVEEAITSWMHWQVKNAAPQPG